MDLIAFELKQLLLARSKTLAAAESLTAGNVQALIASASGSSNYFLGGITTYSISQKVEILGVDRNHAELTNCVSEQVATEMALGARRMFHADIAVSTTGYAEPDLDRQIKRPFAFYAIDYDGDVTTGKIEGVDSQGKSVKRVPMQQHVAHVVIDQLIKILRRNANSA